MDSKQRILSAICNQQVKEPCSSFRAENTALEKIYRYVGYRDFQRLQDDLDIDLRHFDAIQPKEIIKNEYCQNYWGERYIYHQTPYGPERENISGAFSQMKSIDEAADFSWISNDDFDYSELAGQCLKNKSRAIMYGSGDIWQRATMMRGMENYFIDMYENPEFCHYLSKRLCDFYIEDYRRAYEASRRKIDVFLIYSDLGSQRAPLISNTMLNQFVLPYLKRVSKAVHEMGAYLFFHTCGMVTPLINSIIDAGVDILDPIQPVSESMQPEALANEFKGKVCFHGGIDVQRVLVDGNETDVELEVKRYIQAFENKNGYICCPSHFIQKDIPVSNILRLYKTINELKY